MGDLIDQRDKRKEHTTENYIYDKYDMKKDKCNRGTKADAHQYQQKMLPAKETCDIEQH